MVMFRCKCLSLCLLLKILMWITHQLLKCLFICFYNSQYKIMCASHAKYKMDFIVITCLFLLHHFFCSFLKRTSLSSFLQKRATSSLLFSTPWYGYFTPNNHLSNRREKKKLKSDILQNGEKIMYHQNLWPLLR